MKKLIPFLLVGIGGFLGANARYLTGRIFSKFFSFYFPISTFFVNITGCFLLGIVGYIAIYLRILDPDYFRYFLGIGFLGAFTTFSTFEYETNSLFEDGSFVVAAFYVFSSVVIGFIAVRLGILTAKQIVKIL